MTAEEIDRAWRMAHYLALDRPRIDAIAKKRGWLPGTVRNVTLEGCLGWSDSKLAFIYRTGVKLRWREGGERKFDWTIGKPCLWRGEILGRWHDRICICEGETDALSLIDAGAECDGRTLVTALPSATSIRAEWFERMRGKQVIIAPHNDDPGQRSAEKLTAILNDIARSVAVVGWKQLRSSIEGSSK